MGGLAFPSLDSSIATMEGFGVPGTIATRQNNPGNIIAGPFASGFGGVPGTNGIAAFPDVASGTAAEDTLLQQFAASGKTLGGALNTWVPPTAPGNSPAATQNYIDSVSGKLGVPADTPLSALGNFGAMTGAAVGAAPTAVGAGLSTAAQTFLFGVPATRLAAFILGLIFIAAGLWSLKSTQTIIGGAVRVGKRGLVGLAV
jgi:hypothetical protein